MPQDKERKYFASKDGRLNADDGAAFVGLNEWVNAENIRSGSTDKGITGTQESIGSTLLKSNPQPSVVFIEIGSAEDETDGRFCYFKFNTTGTEHKIVCYDSVLDTEFNVLLSSQVTGGLNFDKNYLIHSARIIGGILYWTDNLNDQRRVNIDAGIKLNNPSYVTAAAAYTSPVSPEVITVLRPPPTHPLTVSKVTQTSPVLTNNFVANNAFQFSYRYNYRDGENSVPAVYSLLINYNTKAQTFNRIDVIVPVNEFIPQDVQSVDILVKYGNENTFYVIKSWDKNVPFQSQEIINHNSGTQLLTYAFYNDQVGTALGEFYSTKPFDSVPILSETLELFENRLGFGNNIEGYDTPSASSLTAAAVSQTIGGTITGRWISITYNFGASVHYFLDIVGMVSGDGFYNLAQPPPPPFPATQPFGVLTLVATGPANFAIYVAANFPGWIGGVVYTGDVSTITGAPSPATLIGARVFKSGASYKLSIVFYDFGDRKSGITGGQVVSGVPLGQVTYNIPDRAYNSTTFVTAINWILSNINAINEIPIWATHYSIVITRCLKTRFFLQARSLNSLSSMTYVAKDANDEYTFATTTYSDTLSGVGIDITNLQSLGMGYLFQDGSGDVVNVYLSGSAVVYRLKIIAQDGRWIICELQDLSTLGTTTQALFEIFTPFTPSINEPYNEVSQTFPVNNSGTPARQYSNVAGSIRGDVTILERGVSPNNYLTENMSPNDKFYLNWWTDRGRPNFIDTIGQRRKETNISWSNTIIPGTKINGLSTFDALDEKNLPQECGAIRKLQLTSKVQDELGVVLLAVCEKETASLYLGETQQYGSNKQTTLTLSTEIIGSVNILKGSRGTTNPESVTAYKGRVYWYDAGNGRIVQYSENGLDDISDHKMRRFWKQFSDLYMSMTVAEIEALGSRPFVFMTVDPYHEELLISIPKLSNTPPKGYLPDYPFIIYPFDIFDAQGKTIVYELNLGEGLPKWKGSYSFNPEGFVTLQNKLYSFKQGNNYLHNQTTSYNNFYGIQYKSRIMFVSNQNPAIPKVYNNIAVKVNMKPTFAYGYIDSPYQQATNLIDNDYRDLEGLLYATFYRNRLIPTATGFVITGLLTGEKMRGAAMFIMLEFTISQTPLELEFVSVGFDQSRGQPF